MSDTRFWKVVVVINGAVPFAMLAWDGLQGNLGPSPSSFVLHSTGLLSLIFLLLTLSITPLRRLTGWNTLIGFRRSLGLLSFFYACVHLAIYVGFVQDLNIGSTIEELLTRRYLQVGLAAFLMMVPLAVTSTNAMVARLGARRWKMVHRLAYLAAGLGAMHYYMQVKADIRQPSAFAAVAGILLAARFGWHYFDLRKAARRPPAPIPPPASRKFWSGELQVARVFDETPEVRTFRLVSPDGGRLPFDYLPGQYLNIHLNINGRRVNRSYTLASSPTRCGYCELSIKREDAGLASSYLHGHLHEGDRLRISAAAGKFIFTGQESESVVLIAGGVGITPLMSITRYLTDRAWAGEIFLLIAARTENDLIFKDELDLLQKRFPNLRVCVTLTRVQPDDAWNGQQGRVSLDWLTQSVPDLARRLFYVCGPDAMMSSTRELLLKIGVPQSKTLFEAFVSPGVAVRSAEADGEPVIAPAESEPWSTEGRLTDTESIMPSTATFARSGKTATLTPDTTLLEASESVGVNLPFECRSGICGQCKVRLVAGSVAMETEDALTPSEKRAGWVLACQSRARADVNVDA
jgi:ferredoxin-NADP reductase/DMSO/TMAO reductase YedYZ heme-binding membrane subunit